MLGAYAITRSAETTQSITVVPRQNPCNELGHVPGKDFEVEPYMSGAAASRRHIPKTAWLRC